MSGPDPDVPPAALGVPPAVLSVADLLRREGAPGSPGAPGRRRRRHAPPDDEPAPVHDETAPPIPVHEPSARVPDAGPHRTRRHGADADDVAAGADADRAIEPTTAVTSAVPPLMYGVPYGSPVPDPEWIGNAVQVAHDALVSGGAGDAGPARPPAAGGGRSAEVTPTAQPGAPSVPADGPSETSRRGATVPADGRSAPPVREAGATPDPADGASGTARRGRSRSARQVDAGPAKRPWRKRHPALLGVVVLAAVTILVVAYYAVVLLIAQDRITRADVLRVDGPEILEPAMQEGAETYLIVVADGAGGSGPAEITALAHVSADDSQLVIVTFPRDTLVDVPPCGDAQKPVPAFTGTIASAYAEGGGRCSVAAVQALSGIRINHYLGVDLARFPAMIDSLGGVSVCLTAPLQDPEHSVSLPAGQTELWGSQATDYVRAVAGGTTTDPARASRQISFLSTIFGDALGASTLANPVRVTKFAFAVADVLTLDPDTSLGELRDLGSSLRDLSAGREAGTVSIVAPPVLPPASSGDASAAYVELDPDGSRAMFDAIITGQPLADVAQAAPPPGPTPQPPAPTTGAAVTGASAAVSPPVSDC